MNLLEALLDSWDRQCRIVSAVSGRIDEGNKNFKPSEDGWPIYEHLAHIHLVRRYFLSQLDKEGADALDSSFRKAWEDPIDNLEALRKMLDDSALAVRHALSNSLKDGVGKAGWYDNPVLYLQHMVWHEGWHIGLIYLALRLGGQEPPEEWDESNVWGEWRTEEW